LVYWREFTSRRPSSIVSSPPLISFQTVLCGSRPARDWSTYASSTVAPGFRAPASGSSSPAVQRQQCVLHAPLVPTNPTIAGGGQGEAGRGYGEPAVVPRREPVGSGPGTAGPGTGRDVDLAPWALHAPLLGEQALVRREPRLRLRMPRARAHAHPLELARER